jgi:hypothetical protein
VPSTPHAPVSALQHRSRFSPLAGDGLGGSPTLRFGQVVAVYGHPRLERKFRLRRSMISAFSLAAALAIAR